MTVAGTCRHYTTRRRRSTTETSPAESTCHAAFQSSIGPATTGAVSPTWLPVGRKLRGMPGPIVWQDGEPRDGYDDTWFPCPDGNPQRLCRALGFRERNVAELELRVLLGDRDGGVCQVIVDEDDDEIYVRVIVCCKYADKPSRGRRHYVDCPVRVSLGRPLGERAVIDQDTDEELPLFIPEYLNNVPQPDHGYHPVRRRSG